MSISSKKLHVAVLPLHVPQGPLLCRGHPNGLGRRLGAGRLGSGGSSRRSVRGVGSRCWDGFFGRHRLRRLRLVFAAGRRPLRFGAGAGSAGALPVSGVRPPAWARRPEPAQALQQALKPRGVPHCQPFLLRIILLVVVQENRKGNTGAAGIYHISVDVCELEAQGAQGTLCRRGRPRSNRSARAGRSRSPTPERRRRWWAESWRPRQDSLPPTQGPRRRGPPTWCR